MFERLDSLWERGVHMNYKDMGRVSRLAMTHYFMVQSRKTGTTLGLVKWYAQWRKYCFYPYPSMVFDPQCLTELAEYCTLKTEQHREANPVKAKKRVRPYLSEMVEG